MKSSYLHAVELSDPLTVVYLQDMGYQFFCLN